MTTPEINPLDILLEDELLRAIIDSLESFEDEPDCADAREPTLEWLVADAPMTCPIDGGFPCDGCEDDDDEDDFVFIEHVIYNDPATIIFWSDGTKTMVKARGGDKYTRQVGFLMCLAKKLFGNDGTWYDVLREYEALDDELPPTLPKAETEEPKEPKDAAKQDGPAAAKGKPSGRKKTPKKP